MKAVVNERYGSPDILEIRDVPAPVPGPGDVLVRVHATTVNRTDAAALRAHPWFVRPVIGYLRPRNPVLGLDFAGTVEEVGTKVDRFAPGDRVFGLTPGGNGAHAELVCLPADGPVAKLPDGVAFADSVVAEGAWYANTYVERFRLRPGHRILVYGASGAIGSSAVQLAKIRGATVVAVVPTRHVELARDLGADRVVDHLTEDFTAIGETFDFVLDAVGKTTYFRCKSLLGPNGVYSATDLGPWWQNVWLSLWSAITRSGRVVFPTPRASREFVEFLSERLADGSFRAVVDRRVPLDEIADAYRYVETGTKVGIVVVEVLPDDS